MKLPQIFPRVPKAEELVSEPVVDIGPGVVTVEVEIQPKGARALARYLHFGVLWDLTFACWALTWTCISEWQRLRVPTIINACLGTILLFCGMWGYFRMGERFDWWVSTLSSLRTYKHINERELAPQLANKSLQIHTKGNRSRNDYLNS